MVFGNETISWGELWQEVNRVSRYFSVKLGDSEQKVVSLLATNSTEFIVIYLAVLHSGHIVMPIDPVYKKLEIDAIIRRVAPFMIVFHQRYKNQIGEYSIPAVSSEKVISDNAEGKASYRTPADKQIASITFTSGTSGNPKAVPNTHSNHLWNIKVCSKVWVWTPDDTLLITLPLSHWYGLVMGLSGCIYHGNTLFLAEQSFDTKAVLRLLESGKISIFTHAPIAYMKILGEKGNYDLSKVRLFISGSAPLAPKLWRDFNERFGVEVLETYGSSETGRIAANTQKARRLGSPGKVLPGVDLRLSDEGEILIKSKGVFPGYWNNPEATKKATTKDGYWRTGDIGELNEGYVIIKSRVQERIRKFGYTVSPRDVEWALMENSSIREVFVMGEQVEGQSDDRLYFFVSGDISPKDLEAYCKLNLPFSWRPDKVFFLDKLPRTRNGKPDVSRMKAMAV